MSCAKRHFKSFHKKEFAELFEDGGDAETDSAQQITNNQWNLSDPAQLPTAGLDAIQANKYTSVPTRAAWKYFVKDPDDPKYVICQIAGCHAEISLGSYTPGGQTMSSAKRHLRKFHQKEFTELFGHDISATDKSAGYAVSGLAINAILLCLLFVKKEHIDLPQESKLVSPQ